VKSSGGRLKGKSALILGGAKKDQDKSGLEEAKIIPFKT